jgi:hypothetical protein
MEEFRKLIKESIGLTQWLSTNLDGLNIKSDVRPRMAVSSL